MDKHAHVTRLTLLVVPPFRGRGLGSNSKEYDTTEQNTISVYNYESRMDSHEFSPPIRIPSSRSHFVNSEILCL